MKVIALATMAALAGVVAQAGETVPTAELSCDCLQGRKRGFWREKRAGHGVRVCVRRYWRDDRLAGRVRRLPTTRHPDYPGSPDSGGPEARCFRLCRAVREPYIRVFYAQGGRAQDPKAAGASCLLAHVLVHEITHVLQPTPRHSTEGVMKARWTKDDISSMMWGPMPFTSEDINLIRLGLAARSWSLTRRR